MRAEWRSALGGGSHSGCTQRHRGHICPQPPTLIIEQGQRGISAVCIYVFSSGEGQGHLYAGAHGWRLEDNLYMLGLSYFHWELQTKLRLPGMAASTHYPGAILPAPEEDFCTRTSVRSWRALLRKTESAWATLACIPVLFLFNQPPWEGDLCVPWFSSFEWRLLGLWLRSSVV